MNKDKRIFKYELMSMDNLEKIAITKFNRSITLRDLYKNSSGLIIAKCICCLREKVIRCSFDLSDFCASHYFLSDRYASTRFDRRNVNGGCSRCNRYLSGNLSEYKINLIKKIGEEDFELLEIKHNTTFKPTWKFLVDTIFESEEISKARIKELGIEKMQISI